MASQDHPNQRTSLYPQVDLSHPDSVSPFVSNPNNTNSNSLYPSVYTEDLANNLFPDSPDPMVYNRIPTAASAPSEPVCVEETIISIPGAIVHLIDNQYSVELACGDFSIIQIRQGDSIVAVLARVADDVQWPLMKDEAAVKVDDSHYFFSLRPPGDIESGSDSDEEKGTKRKGKDKKKEKPNQDPSCDILNYGLSFASKGQEKRLKDLDRTLEMYTAFSVQKLSVKNNEGGLDGMTVNEASPEDLRSADKKELMEERCAAYWTTLAPNVEDYSGSAAKLIAAGSGQLIRGILWCGDVTVDRLKWGNEFLKKRMSPSEKCEVSRSTMKKIKRVKGTTKMTKKVATGVLSGVVKVSGYVTSSVVNSKVGQKFFSKIPGEIILASFDGFNKICDALEVAGTNVMSTSSTVTTSLVTHRYGEEAGQATQDGLHATGHAIGTAWAVFKIRQALSPKSALKATTIAKTAAKAAAEDYKTKRDSKSKSKSK
ncbi:hypothetical protein V2J09_021553 [Rumex salicifolius]